MGSHRPEKRPLDEGVIDGPEPWRVIDGVIFCHWDRWLLRLALAEKGGIAALAWLLRERVTDPNRRCDKDGAEALHLQMVDLQRRLAQVQRAPETLLDAEERASLWLHQKAMRRVWHSRPRIRTAAMRDTPRRRFTARALRGHWSAFPVSPAPYESALDEAIAREAPGRHARTSDVVGALEDRVLLLAQGAAAAERVALYRAALTAIAVRMESLDDSLSEAATAYAEVERAYLVALRELPERAALIVDLVEFATWEDYGLTTQVERFLAGRGEEDAAVALAALEGLIRELKAAGLTSKAEEARRFLAALLRGRAARTAQHR